MIQPERIWTEWTNELRRNIRVYPTCSPWPDVGFIRPLTVVARLEVRPDEELPADCSVSQRRILVPTALDKASGVALDYASALARRFGSELAVLYAFEDSDYAGISVVEAKLLACFSALLLRHLEARVFLRPGPTGERVKAVANALGADLVVTSSDYHRRFLSYLTHAETGILRVQGFPCPVVVVNAALPLGRT